MNLTLYLKGQTTMSNNSKLTTATDIASWIADNTGCDLDADTILTFDHSVADLERIALAMRLLEIVEKQLFVPGGLNNIARNWLDLAAKEGTK